ncbi:hypothetical protein L1987_71159 [Smallanthus sonchifolius]|uniref:Uncharacterized protein n=1 Tax=Smallanthus sonchifolius TaxID=185202 RepID=A0ACB9ASH2_9ASTR|nr:hypothetical protein L1987_71159 [Smallanthus sonchifolius]
MRSHESGEILTFGDGNFIKYEETGVKQVQNPAFLLVAGVLGERLGYNGINVPIDTNTRLPILGVEWQKMENPDLRKSTGMKDNQKGVRIRRIDLTAPEYKVLKPSDIILSFDGVDIANDGTVPFWPWRKDRF